MPKPFEPATLYDALDAFTGGVNEGDSPLDIPSNVMAGAINTTVRGKFVTHRPAYVKRPITFANIGVATQVVQQPTAQVKTPNTQDIIVTEAFTITAIGTTVVLAVDTEYVGNIGDVCTIIAQNLIQVAYVTITGWTATTLTMLINWSAQPPVSSEPQSLPFNLRYLGPPTPQAPITVPGVFETAQTIQNAVQSGYFQGSCQATDDAGNASLVALISQRLFQFLIQGNSIRCSEIIIPGGAILPVQPQAWLWQSERWVIIQDGVNQALFLDLNGGVGITPVAGVPNFGTVTRSNYGVSQSFSTTTAGSFASGGIPAVGAVNTLILASASNLLLSDIVTIQGEGTFTVQSINGATVTLSNLTATNVGSNFGSGVAVTWTHIGQQMPPAMMGAYGMGRNWFALPGGLTFIAGDIVRGASGTLPYAFRDAVLNITENNFIVGGGSFSIPASGGETIQAMMFLPTLNASLGQGPLQVFTNCRVFSCNAPVDRLTWQTLTNPILTVSLISNGAEGQNSTVIANGDPLFRSVDGIRSLTFNALQFDSLNNLWINSPLSFEVSPTLNADNTTLLQWGSAIVFDNRHLTTTGPQQSSQGVYFTGIVPINFDTTSTMKAKSNPVWDAGVWTGMNVLQLMTGQVQNLPRAFAFCLNTSSSTAGIELYEILPSTGPLSQIADYNGTTAVPITWQFDSASLRFKVPRGTHVYMFLSNGEIAVDNLIGTVSFTVQYSPDQYPVWTLWQSWQSSQNSANVAAGNPDFLPRQGLGEPSPTPCDAGTNRPLRNFFTLQTRTIITGHCVFVGAFYEAQTLPMPKFAKISCPLPAITMSNPPPAVVCGDYAGTIPNFTPNVSCMVAIDVSTLPQPNIWWWANGVWTITQGTDVNNP